MRIIKEACSASESSYLNFIKNLKIQSKTIISHIRLATQGEVSVRNTQPFSRELGGRQHVFVHNGNFPTLSNFINIKSTQFKPIGNTDSELSFCNLMNRMVTIWVEDSPPILEKRHHVFTSFCNDMQQYGIANFIYSESDYTFIHSHKRLIKPTTKEASPGLYILHRNCPVDPLGSDIDGLKIKSNKPQNVIIVASVPLRRA